MSRRGFTLVELLVVTGIFSVLFAMVLSGARPSASGQVRRAAQQIASVLLSTQSKALGNPAGAGVVLEPVAGGSPAVKVVSGADMLPWITGSGSLTVLTATTARITFTPDNADPADGEHAYKLQLCESGTQAQPATAWFAVGLTASGTTITGTASFRTAAGQTAANTIWPQPLGGGTFDVRAARYPGAAEAVYACPRAAAIDLRYSGIGDDPTTTWGGLAGKGAIALAFDSVGGVDVVMQQVLAAAADRTPGREPVHPLSPVYLLVAAQADIDADSALASDRSMWVAVHPQTGRVSVAANVPQTDKNATALRAARAKARAQTMFGK